ncbi:MAG: Signal peptidase I-like protein [Actinomycetia bacterium]|nr:Signal peptidase I-like protein [Actinomycetes bacterium]
MGSSRSAGTPDPADAALAAGNGSAASDSAGDDSAADDSAADDSADEDSADEDGAANGGGAKATAGGGGRAGARKRPFWRELAIIVVAALVLTVIIKVFLFQVFSIPSASMENTLQPGDRILVNRLVYHLRGIDRGDIVVFSGDGSWGPPPPPLPSDPVTHAWDDFTNLIGLSAPGTDYVKRVIGLPGDHVQCCDSEGRVMVNGVALSESSYLYPGDQPNSDNTSYSIKVPPGRLFVLGDHRSDSCDSRCHMSQGDYGTIPENEVVGRAFVIIWPLSRINDLPIPSTFKQAALGASTAAVNYGPAVGGGSAAAGVLAWRRRRSRRRTR